MRVKRGCVLLAVVASLVLAVGSAAWADFSLTVRPQSMDLGVLSPGDSRSFSVTVTGDWAGGDEKATYVAASDAYWLNIEEPSGEAPTSFKATVTIDPNMVEGSYTGTIQVDVRGPDPADPTTLIVRSSTVTISITVAQIPSAPLTVNPVAVNVGIIYLPPGEGHEAFSFPVAVTGGPLATGEETAGYVASTDAIWIDIDEATGDVPGTFKATVSVPSDILSGTYTGTITVQSTLDPSQSQTIAVSMTIVRVVGDQLVVSPETINVEIPNYYDLSPRTYAVEIRNADPTEPNFTWSASVTVPWLSLSQETGTGSTTISVVVDPTMLPRDAEGAQAQGRVVVLSSIDSEAKEVTFQVTYPMPSTGVDVFPGRLFWSMEKAEGTELGEMDSQNIVIFSGPSGWSVTVDQPFIQVEKVDEAGLTSSDLVSTTQNGTLRVTPLSSFLDTYGYGRFQATISVWDRWSGMERKVSVVIDIRHPGDPVDLPVPPPEIEQIRPDYVYIEATDASWIDFDLHVPDTTPHYASPSTCAQAGGAWVDPDGVPGNLNEYCNLDNRVYLLVEFPDMIPGTVYAVTSRVPEGIAPVFVNGLPTPDGDAYFYAVGPVPTVPFGPFQLLGLHGRAVVSSRIGSSLATAQEVQRVEIHLQTPEGTWRVTEHYDGETYTYDASRELELQKDPNGFGYVGTWGQTPVTMVPGDGVSQLYRMEFTEDGFHYTYEVKSLDAGRMEGRWRFSYSDGESDWETFEASRVLSF